MMKSELEAKISSFKALCNKCLAQYVLKFQRKNTSDYVIIPSAPEMMLNAITVCVWIKTEQSSGEPSIAVKELYNGFLMYLKKDLLKVYMLNEFVSSYENIEIKNGTWRHICFTWDSQDGNYSFYKDGNLDRGGLFHPSTKSKIISGGGTWVLGQDQDAVGGGFDIRDAFQGEMAELNIWNKVVCPTEILEMSKSCRQVIHEGNVKTWKDFISKDAVKGNVVKILKPTCC